MGQERKRGDRNPSEYSFFTVLKKLSKKNASVISFNAFLNLGSRKVLPEGAF